MIHPSIEAAPKDEIFVIPGTPDSVSPLVPSVYTTKDLKVVEAEEETLRYVDWLPEVPELFYDVFYQDQRIGDISTRYDYSEHSVTIGNVYIDSYYTNRGFGKQLYSCVPSMVLPCGRSFEASQFSFISTERRSDEANRVWKSLARQGLATELDLERSYAWIR